MYVQYNRLKTTQFIIDCLNNLQIDYKCMIFLIPCILLILLLSTHLLIVISYGGFIIAE